MDKRLSQKARLPMSDIGSTAPETTAGYSISRQFALNSRPSRGLESAAKAQRRRVSSRSTAASDNTDRSGNSRYRSRHIPAQSRQRNGDRDGRHDHENLGRHQF